ncbi:MAG: UDP-N-acetylglucosamine 2-epimerase (non-hydrolyzing) [Gemmatimonadetes bacterium]|nr:UDP-N-acetylglucosamine 2-epimerase (non-hydrolyzing) [Gemmatimonadota bacterium]
MGHGGKYRVCVIVGTRAEAIKLAPVILELGQHRQAVETLVVTTAQHRDMLSQGLDAFGIKPHVDLGLAVPNKQALADFTARAMLALSSCFSELRPDLVLVQGDTTTVLSAALAAHYLGIPVGHIEAGLRSGNMRNPFPEELNRRLASVVADLHFAPTETARENLRREGVADDRVIVTGNTIVDALRRMPRKGTFDESRLAALPWEKRRVVLCTVHRRENIGEPLANVCRAIAELATMHTETHFVLPVHPNPRVHETIHDELSGLPRVELLDPLGYSDLVELLRRSEFAMTDSGGIQEECASLGKPVLVLRRNTDRPEVIASGFGCMVGTETLAIVDTATRLLDDYREIEAMTLEENPFGDGLAAQRIVQSIMRRAPRHAGAPPVSEGPALLPTRRAVER